MHYFKLQTEGIGLTRQSQLPWNDKKGKSGFFSITTLMLNGGVVSMAVAVPSVAVAHLPSPALLLFILRHPSPVVKYQQIFHA